MRNVKKVLLGFAIVFTGLVSLNAQEVDAYDIVGYDKDMVIGNGCDEIKVEVTSRFDYDFKDNRIILFNASWNIERGLFNNGKLITPNEAMQQGLLIMLCPNDYIERVKLEIEKI